MSLWSDFLTHDGRLVDKWSQYFPVYERHLRRFVDRPILFLEIGVGEGGSLQMWKKFFGPHARLVGLDINSRCKEYEETQIDVRIGDQSNPAFLDAVLEEFGAPDIVVDDGSHIMDHVVASFRALYPRVDRNGVYLVEDLHTAYWPAFGGGVGRPGSFMELCKSLLDELNADISRDEVAPTAFTRSTLSMHFYDSMAVFERGQRARNRQVKSGQGAPA
jgi:cephalosporin hydroxylase